MRDVLGDAFDKAVVASECGRIGLGTSQCRDMTKLMLYDLTQTSASRCLGQQDDDLDIMRTKLLGDADFACRFEIAAEPHLRFRMTRQVDDVSAGWRGPSGVPVGHNSRFLRQWDGLRSPTGHTRCGGHYDPVAEEHGQVAYLPVQGQNVRAFDGRDIQALHIDPPALLTKGNA